MDTILALGVALDTMTDGTAERYDGTPMRSALPNAPTIAPRATLRERWAARGWAGRGTTARPLSPKRARLPRGLRAHTEM
jgi:hypothetical protein